jgi:LCP family protein required for cell wall assembly
MYEGLRNLEVPGGRKSGRRRRVVRRAFRLTLLLMAVLLVFGGAWIAKFANNFNKAKDETLKLPPATNDVTNVLVLGSDKRSVIGGSEREERQFAGGSGQRADTIILIHISPNAERAVVMSIQRDLWVDIPGHGQSKINAAYAYGGAPLMIKTVQGLTGITINHYVEVNFAGFREIVDRLGGVDIFVNRPLIDRRSGLNIPKPGCIHMDGGTALSFVRARYIDPTADLGRIQRQQLFMRTVLRKVKSAGVVLNPGKLDKVTTAIGKHFKIDNALDINQARSITNTLSGDPKRVDFRQVPVRGARRSGQSALIPIPEQAGPLFAALKNDTPLPRFGKTSQSIASPRDVKVKVFNGSGVDGLGGQFAEKLRAAGFVVVEVATARRTVERTTLEYINGSDQKVDLVKKYFPDGQTVVGEADQVTDVLIYLGPDAAPSTASPTAKPAPKQTSTKATGSSCG